MRLSRVLLAGTAVAAAGIATSAFTASNTVPDSTAGYAKAAVTGATVTKIEYVVNATDTSVLDSVKFTATEDITGMKAYLQLKKTDGTNVGTPITCTIGVHASSSPITCLTPARPITDFQSVALTVAQ